MTLADAVKVQRDLAEVRETGIAWDLEQFNLGVSAVGVPVRDGTREVVAAIEVVVPVERFGPDRRDFIAARALETAGVISRQLGFTG